MRVIKSITKQFYLARFHPQFDTTTNFGINRHPPGAPAFMIIRELSGPQIPSDLQADADYFVLEVVRKFRVRSHQAAAWFSTEELK